MPLVLSFVLVLALVQMCIPTKENGYVTALQERSNSNLRSLGELVKEFERDHQRRPTEFGEFIDLGKHKDLLLARGKVDRPLTGKIEEWADYELSTRPDILVSERRGLWDDGSVAVCREGLTVTRFRKQSGAAHVEE